MWIEVFGPHVAGEIALPQPDERQALVGGAGRFRARATGRGTPIPLCPRPPLVARLVGSRIEVGQVDAQLQDHAVHRSPVDAALGGDLRD